MAGGARSATSLKRSIWKRASARRPSVVAAARTRVRRRPPGQQVEQRARARQRFQPASLPRPAGVPAASAQSAGTAASRGRPAPWRWRARARAAPPHSRPGAAPRRRARPTASPAAGRAAARQSSFALSSRPIAAKAIARPLSVSGALGLARSDDGEGVDRLPVAAQHRQRLALQRQDGGILFLELEPLVVEAQRFLGPGPAPAAHCRSPKGERSRS